MSRESIASVFLVLLPLALTALATLAAWGTRALTKLIKDRRVALALEVIANGAAAVVADLAQHVVADLKDPAKPGTWSSVAAATVRVRAVERVKQLYPQAVALAQEALANPDRINDLLGTVVERAVVELKTKAPSKPAAPETLPSLAADPVVLGRGTVAPPEPIAPGLAHPAQLFAPAFDPTARQTIAPEVVTQIASETLPRDGQRGSVDVRTLLAIVTGSLGMLCALAALAIYSQGCDPTRRFVLDHTDGVPSRVACVPRTQRCSVTDAGVFLPVQCSDDRREWPALPLRPDGSQRTCAPDEGCEVVDGGIARCTSAADGGAR